MVAPEVKVTGFVLKPLSDLQCLAKNQCFPDFLKVHRRFGAGFVARS